MLLIDCGLMFPEAYMLGVDLVIPDISALAGTDRGHRGARADPRPRGPYRRHPLSPRELGCPADLRHALTLGLLQEKFKEHGLERRGRNCTGSSRGRPLDLGPFEVEFFRAAHSIVDGVGLAMRTPAGPRRPYRRLQARPDPGRRPADRPRPAGRLRRGGGAAAAGRLHQRREGGLHPLASGSSARPSPGFCRAAGARSWWRPSPPTSTASSR